MIAMIALYLAAIATANVTVALFGPGISVVNAFWLIGLDLTLRDRLHDAFGEHVVPAMLWLIVMGGVISLVVMQSAWQIAVASSVAFMLATGADALVYAVLHGRRFLVRSNGSNLVSATVDSVVFPTLAFGAILPAIVLGQLAAKIVGGLLWSLVIHAVSVRRRPA